MKALLVDGLNLIRRIYAAVPSSTDNPADTQDHIASVIQSCRASLKRALTRHHPSHALVVLEYGGISWRHRIFPDYKKDRPPMPADLKVALPEFEAAFRETGVNSFHLDGYEADDVLATLATKIASRGGEVIILSTDRIQCQLIGEHILVFDHFASLFLDAGLVQNKFGVSSEQIVDVQALAGDASQSIPGVKSVGRKTAAKLINQFGDLERLLANVGDIGGKLGEHLESGIDDALIAQTLFRLKTDIDLGINLNQFRYFQENG